MMSTSTAASVSLPTVMAQSLRFNLGYAEILLKDIPADKFGHMPHPDMNHPAFCIGHLSIYPDKVLGMIAKGDLAIAKPEYDELFDQTVKCVEQDGRYPAKDEIVSHFNDRHTALLNVLGDITDDVLAQPNPTGLASKLPTMGSMVNFMVHGHIMLHLGQVSAWRRAVGLGSAM
jgi:hypothetical protein